MNRYTTYCTEEQTRKALKLGAPILKFKNAITRDDIPHFIEGEVMKDWTLFFCPTAEEMLGWLEETYDLHINIDYRRNYADDADGNIVDEWYYYCFFLSIADNCFYGEDTLDEYSSRKEATLAAIDAALDYLENLKQ